MADMSTEAATWLSAGFGALLIGLGALLAWWGRTPRPPAVPSDDGFGESFGRALGRDKSAPATGTRRITERPSRPRATRRTAALVVLILLSVSAVAALLLTGDPAGASPVVERPPTGAETVPVPVPAPLGVAGPRG